MATYKDAYSPTFDRSIKDLTLKKQKEMLKNDISFILEKPYYKAKKIYSQNGLLRKHICANKFRIFYEVDETKKEVYFHFVRKKDKGTYKNL